LHPQFAHAFVGCAPSETGASVMKKTIRLITLLVTGLVGLLHVGPAEAQASRVFVAAQGSDNNPCTFAQPCRSFQHAHDAVSANGEIDVLDPAGYGGITITKAISIQGHGFSGITSSGGTTAITINAASADKISLSGLVIEGAGTGANGIVLNSAKALSIIDSMVRNFAGNGIAILPIATSTFFISRTIVSDNGLVGIFIQPRSGAFAHGAITNVAANNNGGDGIHGDGQFNHVVSPASRVTVTSSFVIGNANGIESSVASVAMIVRDTVADGNLGAGFLCGDGIMSLSHVIATGNANGLSGGFFTYGNNEIFDNFMSDAGAANLFPLGFN
jgi:hypothetical protein